MHSSSTHMIGAYPCLGAAGCCHGVLFQQCIGLLLVLPLLPGKAQPQLQVCLLVLVLITGHQLCGIEVEMV